MEESEPALFLLPSELIGLIADRIGPYHLMKKETVSKKWRETMWRLLSKFDFVRRKDLHYCVTDSQFSHLLSKMNPNRIVSLTIYDYTKLSQNLAELKTFADRLKKFSIPNLPANTIMSIIPYITGLESIKLNCWGLEPEGFKEIGDNLKHLTKLNLANYEFRIELPNLDKLPGLKSFRFYSKGEYVALEQLTALTNLESFTLRLTKNGDQQSIESISHLKKLKKLDVILKQSTGSQWTFLDRLPNLEDLSMTMYDKCDMNSAIETIGRMTHLKRLFFQSPIEDEKRSHLSTLTNLESLTFDTRNDHTTYLSALINLTQLEVSFKAENCDILTCLTNLKRAALDLKPEITKEVCLSLARLPNLESLYLFGHEEASSFQFSCFSSCANLTRLDISCHFGESNCEVFIGQISKLTQLVDLDIEIVGDFNNLSVLTNLERLVVKIPGTPVMGHFSSLGTLPKLSSLELFHVSSKYKDQVIEMFKNNSHLTNLYVDDFIEEEY